LGHRQKLRQRPFPAPRQQASNPIFLP
jgi:hypothetical protein